MPEPEFCYARVAVSPLTVGEKVRPRSGGPPMTIISVGQAVGVAWFLGDVAQAAQFPDTALERYRMIEEGK